MPRCNSMPDVTRMSSSPVLLLLILLVLLHQCQLCSCDTKCYVCDNYFELNMRNKDPTKSQEQLDAAKRYCSLNSLPSDERQNDCTGIDYTGCVKIVTRSWRHHIDKVGYGLRSDDTLIATVVTRDCADVPPGMGYGCHNLIGAGTTTEICYCKGEYCNGAGVCSGQWAAPLLLMLAAVRYAAAGLLC